MGTACARDGLECGPQKGTACAKDDDDDQFTDLGAKVTGPTLSVAASRAWPQERTGTSELSTAPSVQQLEKPVLERIAQATNCEPTQALAEAALESVKNDLACWGSADSCRLRCSSIGEDTEMTKELCRCLFQLCTDRSGSGVPEEVVECEDEALTPRQRLALDTVPRSSGNGTGCTQPMTFTHELLQSNRGIKKQQQHRKAASQMHLVAVNNHMRAEAASWAAARAERRHANCEAGADAGSLVPHSGSPRRQKAGWVSSLF